MTAVRAWASRPALVLAFAAWPGLLLAQSKAPPRWMPQFLGAQFTAIPQWLPPFPSSYSGPNSLAATGDLEMTHTYGAYGGVRLVGDLAGYVDAEMARGAGVSHASGLGGLTNGDVIRQGTVELGQAPYVARAFLRYRVPLAPDATSFGRAPDQLPGPATDKRIEISAGKLAVNDLFDLSRYANSTRTQFLNWGLWQNTAWDFAADTRGYSWGLAVALIMPRWSVRAGSFLMPTQANGNVFDTDIRHARGDQAELTLGPGSSGTVLRVLGYVNHGRLGDYREAIARASETGGVPNIAADDQPGRVKYGFGLNVEQPLADSGETGLLARLGWNDGHTESFVFTEVDRHLSVGAQLSGVRWGRAEDRLGIAAVVHGLSGPHRDYLAAGGLGFLLGDGRLDYGAEMILETYYRLQVGPYLEVSPDAQLIGRPGYNRARGPATVFALRVNARY